MIKKYDEFISEELFDFFKKKSEEKPIESKPRAEKIPGQNCKGCAGVDYLRMPNGSVKCAHCGREPEAEVKKSNTIQTMQQLKSMHSKRR
jgi:hypothetical protein